MTTAARPGSARIGVDIGGTFTDTALEIDGRRYTSKVLTTPRAPQNGVMTGIRLALEAADLRPQDVGLVIHGTTLAANAMIERKGAKTALITTEGFRDVIEMRTESRFEQYDINLDMPAPLVPRHLRFSVSERVSRTGAALRALDEEAVWALMPVLETERIESVAVAFLHAYANPGHEARVRDILDRAMPRVPVSLSSEVSPEMREYERFSTTCANAYLQPLMASYLRSLEEELRLAGFTCPLFLMLSSGGVTTVEMAGRFPVRLVESGPAGGAIFAREVAAALGLEKVLSFDMGGTTAKVCLIDEYQPQTSRMFEVARAYRFKRGSGLPLRIPVIEMVEIGAGGGSIARIDALGRITVGPESAGSEPGPASYGRGGSAPTVTDSDLVLGRIDPASFAGGRIALDSVCARVALEKVSKPLGLPTELAAYGVVEIVEEDMANAARVHAIESGKHLGERTLVAFGGAAPLHVCRVAEKLGISRIVVPANASVGSAVGFLRAPVAYEVTLSCYMRLDEFDAAAANGFLSRMRDEALGVVMKGAAGAPITETRLAYMRYVGQGHEIPVVVPARALTADDADVLQRAYEQAYRGLYGRLVPDSDVEVMSWSVAVSTRPEDVKRGELPQESYAPTPDGEIELFDAESGRFMRVPLVRREALRPGACVPGPAVIVEDQTSVVVGAAFTARIDTLSFIIMDLKEV